MPPWRLVMRSLHVVSVVVATVSGLGTLAFSTDAMLSEAMGVVFVLSVSLALVIEYRRDTARRSFATHRAD